MSRSQGQMGQKSGQGQGQTDSGQQGQAGGAQRNPASDPNQGRVANQAQQPGNPARNNGQSEAGTAEGGRPGQGEQNASSSAAGQQGQGAASGSSSQGNQSSGVSGASSPSGGKGNGAGTGQMPGGGGGPANQGGGGKGPESGATGLDPNAKDETKPTPPAAEAKDPFANDDVAPPNQAATDLTIRRLADALNDADKVKALEENTGMTKEQLEMLARKYEKPKVAPGREAREVEVKIGDQTPSGPGSNLPEPKSRRIDSTKIRTRDGAIPVDQARGNNESVRNIPPAEWLRRYSEYNSTLARQQEKSSKKTAKPQPARAQ
jgi:hypothetical protein